MALTITHTTAADGTFSAAGTTNWNANHTLAGSVALSEVSAATGAVTIASGNNTGIVWNWANTSDSTICHTVGETSAATNGTSTSGIPNQVLLKLITVAASTQSPLSVYSRAAHVFSVSPTTRQILGTAGTKAAPTYSFVDDPGGGIFYQTGAIGFSLAGTDNFNIITNPNCVILDSGGSANSAGISFSDTIARFGSRNTANEGGVFDVGNAAATTKGFVLRFTKARGTPAVPTVITTGDVLGNLSASGYLGVTNAFREAAKISFTSAGTISDATTGIGSIVTISGTTQGTDSTPQPTLVITGGSTATIKFAGTGMFTANGSTIATIGATCPGNAAVQEWLTVTDAAGAVRYIPCF